MGHWLVRGSGIAIVLAGALALACWPRARASGEREAAPDFETRAPGPGGFALAFASPQRDAALAGWISDGGGIPTTIDAAVTEPEPATGVLARAITSALCPAAAHVICGARARLDCGPMPPTYDDDGAPLPASCVETVQRVCGDWVVRHYGWLEDDLLVNDGALSMCLDALRADASEGLSVYLDGSCNELARDAASEGQVCSADWLPCGQNGQCAEGRCEPLATLGEPCVDVPCARGLFCTAGLCDRPTPRAHACDDESTCERRGDDCLDGVCAAHVANGAPCDYDGDCAVASRCVLGRCARVPSTTCSLDEECGAGRTCVGAYAAHCEAIPNLGAPCVTATDCEPWLGCTDGRCAVYAHLDYGQSDVGDACHAGPAPGGCARGLVCVYGVQGYRCETGAPIGERCEADRCVVDAMCVWRVVDGVCAPALCGLTDYFAESNEE